MRVRGRENSKPLALTSLIAQGLSFEQSTKIDSRCELSRNLSNNSDADSSSRAAQGAELIGARTAPPKGMAGEHAARLAVQNELRI